MNNQTNPRHNQVFHHYRNVMKSHIGADNKGLEIGPFDRPYIERNDGIDIRYCDVFDANHLREKVSKIPGRNPDFVVEVDYVLGESNLATIPENFDFVIASHVIEHTPNMIGWLNQVSNMLNSGGHLHLVIPNKLRTFDFYREETTVLDLLDRYETNNSKPQFRSILDSRLHACAYDEGKYRAGLDPEPPMRDIKAMFEDARQKSALPYHDCHVNIFSCNGFRQVIQTVFNWIEFSNFEVKASPPNFIDFYARFWK